MQARGQVDIQLIVRDAGMLMAFRQTGLMLAAFERCVQRVIAGVAQRRDHVLRRIRRKIARSHDGESMLVRCAIRAAVQDPAVDAIMLACDTPGGTVHGTS